MIFFLSPPPISDDTTVMVWDCETGVCLRTLSEHRNSAIALAAHANGQCFASGSYDQSVVIWSSETFDILHRIEVPDMINTLTFAENGHLFIGVYYQGAMLCNILTGEVGESKTCNHQPLYRLVSCSLT